MSVILGFFLGFLAYILLYLGKGIQKYAIEGLKVDKTIKSKHSGIWIFGLILTGSYMLMQWIALLFAPINIIAPLGAAGLIVLLIFSYQILKESITRLEIAGSGCIIAGLVLISVFNTNRGAVLVGDFDLVTFSWISIIVVGVEIVAILVLNAKKSTHVGFILGLNAGTFNALQTVSKRVTSINDFTLTLVFSGLSIGFSVVTLLMTQLAFAKGKANRVIPCYTSADIIYATLLGVIVLTEVILPVQVMGIGIIIAGVLLLTAFKKEDKKQAPLT